MGVRNSSNSCFATNTSISVENTHKQIRLKIPFPLAGIRPGQPHPAVARTDKGISGLANNNGNKLNHRQTHLQKKGYGGKMH